MCPLEEIQINAVAVVFEETLSAERETDLLLLLLPTS